MKYRLEDIDKKNPFKKAPAGYFEELPLRIQTQIASTSRQKNGRKSIGWQLAAASFSIVVLTFFFLPNRDTTENLLAQVDHDDLISYLELTELEEYEITGTFIDFEDFTFENEDILEEMDIDNDILDDVLLEYDLEDQYL